MEEQVCCFQIILSWAQIPNISFGTGQKKEVKKKKKYLDWGLIYIPYY